jgi:DNA or RNA helicases of superfamily II
MAAPGAGKTVFAGAIFSLGQQLGLWNRVLVLVPRLPLVEQWKDDLLRDYHIELDTDEAARGSGREMPMMDGVCLTYQALLTHKHRERHKHAVSDTPTLVVLDEVHHLGEPVHDGIDTSAWSRAVSDLVGDIETKLNVRAVLNLSGTLFRTSPKERISTVKYTDAVGDRGEARIQAVANYIINPETLVRDGILRVPDLFRVGAEVEWVNLREANVVVSSIADLNDDASKFTLRELNRQEEWITVLVRETLERLQQRYRDSRRAPVKALIVTHRQEIARAYAEEANRQMKDRGLTPLAECVVSDDAAAYRKLVEFRRQTQPGILSSVGMVGEGYNCPDIAVLTYASNIQTDQYIRQVVARAQRVSPWEREKLGHALTTAIILPNVPGLVERFTRILAPMVHDIEVPTEPPSSQQDRTGAGSSGPGFNDRELVAVRDSGLDVVSAVSTSGTVDVDPALEEFLPSILEKHNLPASLWPRFAASIDELNRQRPFEKPILGAATTSAAVAERRAATQRQLTAREQNSLIRKKLTHARSWWAQFGAKQGGQPVAYVESEIQRQVGIRTLGEALPEQLKRAYFAWLFRIQRHCAETHMNLPRWAAESDADR